MFVFHSIVIIVGRLPGTKSATDSANNAFSQGICSLLAPGVKFCLSHDSRILKIRPRITIINTNMSNVTKIYFIA